MRRTRKNLSEIADPYDDAGVVAGNDFGFEGTISDDFVELPAMGWSREIRRYQDLQEKRDGCGGSPGKRCTPGQKLNQDGRRRPMSTYLSLGLADSGHCSSREMLVNQ